MIAFNDIVRLRDIELNEKIKDQFLINLNQHKWISYQEEKIKIQEEMNKNQEQWIEDSDTKLAMLYQNSVESLS